MTQFGTRTSPEDDAGPPPARLSRLAVASLVCGIAGVCTGGLSALVGLVLGVVGARRIDHSAGALRGKGLAVGGVIASVIGMILGLLVLGAAAALFLLAYRAADSVLNPQPPTWNQEAAANLQALSKAAFGYASLNDGSLPPADSWMTELEPYLRDDTGQVMAWPATRGLVYSMNIAVGGMKLDDIPHPEGTVLFFIARSGTPPAGEPDDNGYYCDAKTTAPETSAILWVVGFADGHTEEIAYPGVGAEKLIWDPSKAPSQP